MRWEGQATIYNFENGPCYRCLYPDCPKGSQVSSCRNDGVIGMAPGIIGQILAVQFLKVTLNLPNLLVKKMLLVNLLEDIYKVVQIRGRKNELNN